MESNRGVLASGEEIAAAYLEWLDATVVVPEADAVLATALQAETVCLELQVLAMRLRALQVH